MLYISAVREAAGHETGDPGRAGRPQHGAAGTRADAERTHKGTQTQVSKVSVHDKCLPVAL